MPLERFFYHSFPRPPRGIDSALAIMRSMLAMGFVLTPEQHEWKERLRNGSYASADIVKQVRICFTELAPNELLEHSQSFGSFSLEFDIHTLRRFGALPVIYLPTELDARGGGEGLGASLVARSSQVGKLLERLISLKTFLSQSTSDDPVAITFENNHRVEIPKQHAKDLIQSLELGSPSFEQLNSAHRVLGSLFCPTENLRYNSVLDYYRQREWRLTAGVVLGDDVLTRPINADEKNKLAEIDTEFYLGLLEFRKQSFKRVDLCHVMPSYDSKHVLSYVRRIIVPDEAQKEVKALVSSVIPTPSVVSQAEVS